MISVNNGKRISTEKQKLHFKELEILDLKITKPEMKSSRDGLNSRREIAGGSSEKH